MTRATSRTTDFGTEGAESDNLRNRALAVFVTHVVDHLAAAVDAEVDVDIGGRRARD
jgi:hypothetical protein